MLEESADGTVPPAVIPAKGEAREPGSIHQPAPSGDMDPGCRL